MVVDLLFTTIPIIDIKIKTQFAIPIIAQFVARSKRLKDKGQTGETGTFPTQCHLNGEVLYI
jgi:hypothetical protein